MGLAGSSGEGEGVSGVCLTWFDEGVGLGCWWIGPEDGCVWIGFNLIRVHLFVLSLISQGPILKFLIFRGLKLPTFQNIVQGPILTTFDSQRSLVDFS